MNRYSRRPLQIVAALLSFVVVTNLAMPVAANDTSAELFYLSVKLNDVYNHNLNLNLPVTIDTPFETRVEKGGVKTVVSGVVHDPSDRTYPLSIKVTEWVSETNNQADAIELQLKLNQSLSYGPTSKFVYMRTVKLSKRSGL